MPSWSRNTALGFCAAVAFFLTALGPSVAGTSEPAQTPDAQPTPAAQPTPEAAAAPEPTNDCDRIAAPRAPAPSPASVHERREPDWAAAVPACEAMIKAQPAEIRFVDQLGRAQDHLKNYTEAARNYRIASEAGYPDAQLNLGVLYYDGHGALQSYMTAFELFNKAAAASPSLVAAKAMANVGAMYADGRGVAKDDARSLDFEERSVEMGNPNALRLIAIHYFNGAGVARDYQMAAQYLQQAVDVGDGYAMKFLANMIEGGYLGAPDPTKAGELRLRAVQVDPDSRDPGPLQMYRPSAPARISGTLHPRRYVVYRYAQGASYNPAWQAAPGDTRCCPNNMLVCPLGRHFCGH
jgi:tetratricopeptide (TPR) repeat protein